MSDRRFLRRLPEPRSGALDPRLDMVRDRCLARPGATEDFPFGPEVMVFKVGGKIFAALAWEESPLTISLKCDPDRATALREEHASVNPPRYFDKKRWNAVTLDASIDDALLQELVEHSWALVFATLTRKLQAEIGG